MNVTSRQVTRPVRLTSVRLVTPLAALTALLSLPAHADKNPHGNMRVIDGQVIFTNPRTGAISTGGTEGAGAPVGPATLTAAPPGWAAGGPLPVSPNVRHDLTMSNWSIKEKISGQPVGLWEWDTGTQNFVAHYANGGVETLRFEEWNPPNKGGRIVLSGFNSLGMPVRFVGKQGERGAEGTASFRLPSGTEVTWQWQATFP